MQFAPKSAQSSAPIKTVETVETVETPAAPLKPTSEKLDVLKSTLTEKQTELASGKILPGTSEFTEAMLVQFQLMNEIKAEEANIAKTIKEQEIALKRNERIAMVDDMLAAYADVLAINAATPSGENMEEKNAIYAKFKALREPIDNEMLVRIPHTTPSKKAVDGLAPKTDGGEKGKAIIAYLLEQRALGITDTEIKKQLVANGHAVGTVGAVVLAYQRANGEK